mmetsp:Transcript_4059/g.7839  ORF Transcript_4059/g.7839 Transcript_4059/m.7839 type:complete len:116 (+) Transcript_4059:81-428(+)|eukprot:CAMPEP_0175120128 /NCGR_PEP_ID=MMETSP0087-20121206/448_1 /TAXON_ID=136419 /ORGANISM="Unknown Unknown, Strain D1" /LENGTH=115 /DNA_ID=CAMNT_0016401539 /DNA_START=76 /DNA_END=423 /DNA_ORIENTATION=-
MVHPAFVVVDVVNAIVTSLEKEEDKAELAFFDEERRAAEEELNQNLAELQGLIYQASEVKNGQNEKKLPRPTTSAPTSVFEGEIRGAVLAYKTTIQLISDLNQALDSLAQVSDSR